MTYVLVNPQLIRTPGADETAVSQQPTRITRHGWTFSTEFPSHAVGSLSATVVVDTLDLVLRNGMPVLQLDPPLRWAMPDETTSAMEVVFETFVVRAGCTKTLWSRCSDDGAVQVLPLAGLVGPAPAWPPPSLRITHPGASVGAAH